MKYFPIIFLVLLMLSLGCENSNDPLNGKVICIDPGHGGTAETDTFRVGPNGEREEWINLRVALKLAELLRGDGAQVVLTRDSDTAVSLKRRAEIALENDADVFISIHHNAAADTSVNIPIVYFHGNISENQAGARLGGLLAREFSEKLFNNKTPVSVVSDHVIFPGSGAAVLRHSYGIPGVIGEASFFSNSSEELRLLDDAYNLKEAEAYELTLRRFFNSNEIEILTKYSIIRLTPFRVFQEADRMDPTAIMWKNDFEKGIYLSSFRQKDSLEKSLAFLERSIRSFPDSWLAGKAHLIRSEVLRKLGRTNSADSAALRAREFYLTVDQ